MIRRRDTRARGEPSDESDDREDEDEVDQNPRPNTTPRALNIVGTASQLLMGSAMQRSLQPGSGHITVNWIHDHSAGPGNAVQSRIRSVEKDGVKYICTTSLRVMKQSPIALQQPPSHL